MGEPKRQVEIQLGHMCNNRCVFCVSGQETALGRARPMAVEPILERLRAARADGHAKLTLLGGEPTLQPGFLDVVRESVALGFEEIVLFTNGVKTARPEFVDEILATGGRFTWRISLQGATEEAHDRTTRKPGAFARIVRTMEALRARGARITVNMCVVRSNYASVDAFPALLLPFGVTQLHLDMVRPLDAGARSEEELRDMIPHYPDMVPALERMIRGFPDGFDVNIGNLPYCVAPHLARWIHHDGEETATIAVDGDATLSRPWDKYLVKRRDKGKLPSCASCVFEPRCSGVFEAYRAFYGDGDVVPVDPDTLATADPGGALLALRLSPALRAIGDVVPGARSVATSDRELEVTLGPGAASPVVALAPPGARAPLARFERFDVRLVRPGTDAEAAQSAVRALVDLLVRAGEHLVAPFGADALGMATRSVSARLARLRASAPFGPLAWVSVDVAPDGARAEASFRAPGGEIAVVWLGDDRGRPTGGYRLPPGEPGAALVAGLRAVLATLAPPNAPPADKRA